MPLADPDANQSGLLPSEQIPTVIAMTLEAQGIHLGTEAPVPQDPVATTEAPRTPTAAIQNTPTGTLEIPTATASPPPPTAPPLEGEGVPPENLPTGAIELLSPGSGSLVTSPFVLRTAARPGPDSTLRIELLGEDGRLLMREVKVYDVPRNQGVFIGQEVLFDITAVAEAARLQVLIEDEHGRLSAVASIDLILLSLGDPDLNQPPDTFEDIAIAEPKANALIQGGVVRVSGLARLREGQPLRIELQTADGRIVGTRQVAVTAVPGSSYGAFEIDVPYSVDSTTRVRLAVWEPGVRIPGIRHLSSLEVMLSP